MNVMSGLDKDAMNNVVRSYEPFYRLAQDYYREEEYEKSAEKFLMAIEALESMNEESQARKYVLGPAYGNYASCLIFMGKLKEAETALKKSREASPILRFREGVEGQLFQRVREKGLTCDLMNPRLESYRTKLLDAGFSEASMNLYRFWKMTTEKTAFIVNLKELPDGVGAVYGFYSTATLWDERSWEFYRKGGTSDNDCNLRYYREIYSESDEVQIQAEIQTLYNEHHETDKDTLLKIVKERRKAFLSQITEVLKPRGFKKKGNEWRKQLSDDHIMYFLAEKSSYSDTYEFMVAICHKNKVSPNGYYCFQKIYDGPKTGVLDSVYSASHSFDWELQKAEDLHDILNEVVVKYLEPIENGSLALLGKQSYVWEHCTGPRDCCETCWVEKNYKGL